MPYTVDGGSMEESLLHSLVGLPDEVVKDLKKIFGGCDYSIFPKAFTGEEGYLVWANEFFTKMGLEGNRDDQKWHAVKILDHYNIDVVREPDDGSVVLNWAGEMVTKSGPAKGSNEWVFLRPMDLLIFLQCARTPKARALQKGVMLLFKASLDYDHDLFRTHMLEALKEEQEVNSDMAVEMGDMQARIDDLESENSRLEEDISDSYSNLRYLERKLDNKMTVRK